MPDTLRGHEIYYDGEQWRYKDNDQPTMKHWKYRACGYCNKPNRPDEHDACLGELPGVINACCGHGQSDEAYVMFENGEAARGKTAQGIFSLIRRGV
ncbi:hypothetical protein [Jeotgalibacillus terrae]|uniref:HNH endonuclease n=1 Tax=Jeotgalibacillus terrae TaxID=587735 RepID=A0ABW5ZGF9_9BACL|nr:hypothetical protein [Jeotgalibacillus terrae]MBM7580029.1 hypothetical protein [Jeotgalibacillus terrae]